MRFAIALVIAAGCSKAADEVHPAPASPQGRAAPVAAPPTVAKDEGVAAMLAKGTACEVKDSGLPLDCPEYKAIHEYAFQKQGSAEVAATCAGALRDPDRKKRLLAAECLFDLNAVGKTPQLGTALDAIEAETDEVVRRQIAWGIMGAEAVTAKLDARVLAVVTKLAANPASDVAAGYLFSSLFPQYMVGTGPKPPAAAQALAIASIGRDGTGLQREAFNAIRMLDDKPAVCAALGAAIRPDAKHWADAASVLADLGEACAADAARVIDVALARLAAGDDELRLVKKYDRAFDLGAATRAKILQALRAARPRLAEWKRTEVDATIAVFAAPRATP